ncbi:hypothetical protein SOPP22_03155 [Shewanella sp. OPT22]|nr:hypothetical protein SOPP22_03155 [Shewanella sp. OPT22]
MAALQPKTSPYSPSEKEWQSAVQEDKYSHVSDVASDLNTFADAWLSIKANLKTEKSKVAVSTLFNDLIVSESYIESAKIINALSPYFCDDFSLKLIPATRTLNEQSCFKFELIFPSSPKQQLLFKQVKSIDKHEYECLKQAEKEC